MATGEYEILHVEDLPMHDDVRKEFERRSAEIRQGGDSASIPTSLGLKDPSGSIKHFCPKCGAGKSEPFGDYKAAARLHAHGVTVEVYAGGGVIIYVNGAVTVSSGMSQGMGASGQLGYTRVVLTPNEK